MKTTKGQLIKIWNTIDLLSKRPSHRKFAYSLMKNRKLLQDEIDSLQEVMAPTEKWQEFEKKRITLCQSLCDKDDNENPIVKNNQFVTIKNKEEFDNKVEMLREEHKDDIEEFERREEEVKEILEEEVEISPYKINLSVFPEQISALELEVLDEFINDDEIKTE